MTDETRDNLLLAVARAVAVMAGQSPSTHGNNQGRVPAHDWHEITTLLAQAQRERDNPPGTR